MHRASNTFTILDTCFRIPEDPAHLKSAGMARQYFTDTRLDSKLKYLAVKKQSLTRRAVQCHAEILSQPTNVDWLLAENTKVSYIVRIPSEIQVPLSYNILCRAHVWRLQLMLPMPAQGIAVRASVHYTELLQLLPVSKYHPYFVAVS